MIREPINLLLTDRNVNDRKYRRNLGSSIPALVFSTALLAGFLIGPSAARADQSAAQLLKNAVAATLAVKNAAGSCNISVDSTGHNVHGTGTFRFMRPNYIREDVWPQVRPHHEAAHRPSTPHYEIASDGKTIWLASPNSGTSADEVDPNGQMIATKQYADGITSVAGFFFFNVADILRNGAITWTDGGTETWGGMKCQVISGTESAHGGGAQSPTSVHIKIFVGPNNLICRYMTDLGSMGRFEFGISNVRTGVKLRKSDFAYKLPS